MTTRHDPDRSISAWLAAQAPDHAPDDVLEASRDRIRTTRQRRPWWPAWRDFYVHKLFIAAAASTVLVVAVVGYNLLPSLGPFGPGASPSPSPTLLARGAFNIDSRPVELEAMARGATVTGRLTVALPFGPLEGIIVDLQCARSTGDGRLLLGGYVIKSIASDWAQVGSLAGIGLMPGSPVRAAVWLRKGGAPIVLGTSCAAGLEAQAAADPTVGEEYKPISGVVELGPWSGPPSSSSLASGSPGTVLREEMDTLVRSMAFWLE